jgi:hypothetical protein
MGLSQGLTHFFGGRGSSGTIQAVVGEDAGVEFAALP